MLLRTQRWYCERTCTSHNEKKLYDNLVRVGEMCSVYVRVCVWMCVCEYSQYF